MKCENTNKKKGKRVLPVCGERNLAKKKKNDQKRQKTEVEPSLNWRERERERNFRKSVFEKVKIRF